MLDTILCLFVSQSLNKAIDTGPSLDDVHLKNGTNDIPIDSGTIYYYSTD